MLPGLGKDDEVWEVPELFRLGDKDVLIYSPTKESKFTRYFIGKFQDQQFEPESRGKIDLGGYFYAGTVFHDDQGDPIMVAWIKEGRDKQAVQAAGWSGILSVPRRLSACAGAGICTAPVCQLDQLRSGHKRYTNIRLLALGDHSLNAEGAAIDIVAEFDPGTATRFGVKVRCAPSGEEETAVYFDRRLSRFLMDTRRSSQSNGVDKSLLGGDFDLPAGKPVHLRILVDHSVVEAFAENRAAIAGRIYPALPASVGIRVFAEGGTATLRSIDVWQMISIW
jgi:beta-fructofuranosidase